MRLAELVGASADVAQTAARSAKIARLAEVLRKGTPEEVPIAIAFLSGGPRQRKLGVGPSMLRRALPVDAAAGPSLELVEVDRAFGEVAAETGAGSSGRRIERLRDLFRRATADERDFLFRVGIGELRQGALEGIMFDAVAAAYAVPAADVRRAAMASGDLGAVAAAAARDGAAGLAQFSIVLFRPIQPMLAHTAGDVGEAVGRLGEAALEYKMDGARVQIHKSGEHVEVFTRTLKPVTDSVPEIVEAVRALPAREIILDGEAIALEPGRRPHPFQVTMRRFGRRLDVERLRRELPLETFCFDVLWMDGGSLVDAPAAERWSILEGVLPEALRIPRIRSADAAEARRFFERAIEAGHEGVMAKSLDARYEAGRRGQAWLKVKPARTLDLVVLAAEWGHGRRHGWLSNLHLGARDPRTGGFVMLGKTFKGMTDEMLAWQTEQLLALEVARDEWTVHVRPELVVEIAFSDVQESSHYPGGMALRFARVKRYRTDKRAEDADTIDAVQALAPESVAVR
ncbi:MAG: ligase 1 [Candidatus Binatota bacterium]|nr:ligase 1 [Candidatus Binatota bacterium]